MATTTNRGWATTVSLAQFALKLWQEQRVPPSAPATPVRVGHAERQGVHDHLLWAVEHGYLGLNEFEERSVAAMSARFQADLAPLTSDLPHPPVVEERRPRWWSRRR